MISTAVLVLVLGCVSKTTSGLLIPSRVPGFRYPVTWPLNSMAEKVLQSPKWPAEWPYSEEDFKRMDESDDAIFYDSPRLVSSCYLWLWLQFFNYIISLHHVLNLQNNAVKTPPKINWQQTKCYHIDDAAVTALTGVRNSSVNKFSCLPSVKVLIKGWMKLVAVGAAKPNIKGIRQIAVWG